MSLACTSWWPLCRGRFPAAPQRYLQKQYYITMQPAEMAQSPMRVFSTRGAARTLGHCSGASAGLQGRATKWKVKIRWCLGLASPLSMQWEPWHALRACSMNASVPILVFMDSGVPKNSTDVPMMTTRFTCVMQTHTSQSGQCNAVHLNCAHEASMQASYVELCCQV